jgi:hypothetical protein
MTTTVTWGCSATQVRTEERTARSAVHECRRDIRRAADVTAFALTSAAAVTPSSRDQGADASIS